MAAMSSAEKQRVRRARLTAAGICWINSCGKPAGAGRNLCPDCGRREALRLTERRRRLKAEGRCRNCGKDVVPGLTACEPCRAKAASRDAVRYARERRRKANNGVIQPPMGFHKLKGLRAALRAFLSVCGRCGGAIYQDRLTADLACYQCGNIIAYGEDEYRKE